MPSGVLPDSTRRRFATSPTGSSSTAGSGTSASIAWMTTFASSRPRNREESTTPSRSTRTRDRRAGCTNSMARNSTMRFPNLRYALRSLSRARGFTLAVVLTLGLGIGANTAIFSVVRGVLLKPLPHRDGDRLVYLRHSVSGPGGESINFSVPEILDFREGAKSFGGIAEYSSMVYTLQDKQEAVRVNVGLVTGNYFQVMGLSPVIGRLLTDGDDGTQVPPVMVLTPEYWMKRFGGDPTIVGKAVRLGGREVTVVGVVQPAPYFPARMDALLNMVISEHHTSAMMVQGRTHRMTEMIA